MAKKILVYRIAILILCLIGSGFIAGGVWWMSGIFIGGVLLISAMLMPRLFRRLNRQTD